MTVLVTRPQDQAEGLCKRIVDLGGEAVSFPAIAIEALEVTAKPIEYDWLIFVSVNAVRHGLAHVHCGVRTRIAAIGKATAAALNERKIRVDALPESGSTSEDLLAHPAFATVATQSVLIVKGVGGREQLQAALAERGAKVELLDAYRRSRPAVEATAVHELERRWSDEGIDVVTLTSVETLDNLLSLLTEHGKELLRKSAFVAVSRRIVDGARSLGLRGPAIVSRGPDDDSIVGAIAAWHARAR